MTLSSSALFTSQNIDSWHLICVYVWNWICAKCRRLTCLSVPAVFQRLLITSRCFLSWSLFVAFLSCDVWDPQYLLLSHEISWFTKEYVILYGICNHSLKPVQLAGHSSIAAVCACIYGLSLSIGKSVLCQGSYFPTHPFSRQCTITFHLLWPITLSLLSFELRPGE